MKDTFKILEKDQVKLIKRINIISKNRFNIDIIIGYLFYERNYTDNYKMIGKRENESEIDFLLTYPRQQDFPEDDTDKLLLKIIRIEYPNSSVINKTLLTSSDLDILYTFIKRPNEKVELIIYPDLSSKTYDEIKDKTLQQFNKIVNLYTNGPIEYLKNIIFHGSCDFNNHKEIIKLLYNIKFL